LLRTSSLIVVATLAFGAAACDRSPNTPSDMPATGVSQPAPGTATIVGTVSNVGSVSARTAAVASGMTVTVQGTSITAAIDSGGHFQLVNVPPGDVVLHFQGAGVDATLTLTGVGDQERLEITVTVRATTVDLDEDEGTMPGNEVEVEGLISSIDAGAHSFVVNQKTVVVGSSTVVRHGETKVPFTSLAVGNRVHVKGTVSGTTVTASEVIVQNTGHGDD